MRRSVVGLVAMILGIPCASVGGQSLPPNGDPILTQLMQEEANHSAAVDLAQTLLDSIGPRLVGTPGNARAVKWIASAYDGWGISRDTDPYGTWSSWVRGATHLDLIAPVFRELDATLLAWSPGTGGTVEGDVVALPLDDSYTSFETALEAVRGRVVLASLGPPTCRPESSWAENASQSALEAFRQQRESRTTRWLDRLEELGFGMMSGQSIERALEGAGALAILTTTSARGWGSRRVFSAETDSVPVVSLSCEAYSKLRRLADNGQGPRVRLQAEALNGGQVPVANVVATIPGIERPDEFVILSAHLDSWDGADGATDNGAGTVAVMEAMRLLSMAYPRPRRTIIAGHWNAEELGLIGSRAFVEDHPEVVRGLQVVLNQDTGTGRIERVSMEGLLEAGGQLQAWLSHLPESLSGGIDVIAPGVLSGGSDHSAFRCAGVPAFNLVSREWDYDTYTWHTTLDTFDKIVPDDLAANALLLASLAYMASEEEEAMSRENRTLTPDGSAFTVPPCRPARRSGERAGMNR